MKNQMMVITIMLVLVVGAGGFFAGMQYQKSQKPNFMAGQIGNRGMFMRGMGRGMGMGMGMGGAVTGDILTMDDKSITVKLMDGSSKIILLPDSTVISKTDTSSKSDLKIGIKVGVFGMTNSDGSVTAQNIQINPMFRMGGSPRPNQN